MMVFTKGFVWSCSRPSQQWGGSRTSLLAILVKPILQVLSNLSLALRKMHLGVAK